MIFKNGIKNIKAADYNSTCMSVVFCFSLEYIYVVFQHNSHRMLLRMYFVALSMIEIFKEIRLSSCYYALRLNFFETCYSCKQRRVVTLTIKEIMQQKMIKTPLSKIWRTIVIWGNFAAVCVCVHFCAFNFLAWDLCIERKIYQK